MSQTNDYFLIECLSDINASIKKPLQQTLRIKFTTFDVSANYLVFGASSGGIYVFNRNSYEFLKLIPTKEGAVLKLLICPEQKYIIIGTSKGFIVLVENCFSDAKIRYQLFAEHEGNTITDLIWHYNEIYCSDIKGKVSVISLNSLLSKAIFQTPTATLMHLDSPVFQLDACGKYLLVSTKTKTYLCDTEEERYRQIGKKLRDVDLGACFFTETPHQFTKNSDKEKSRFKILKEDESFTSPSLSSSSSSFASVSINNAKIFCARPGFRLWEANLEAGVLCTHQFKTALHENQTESICLDTDLNTHLKTRKMLLQHFDNFGPLQIVHQKFLITYSNNNLIVFDLQGTHLLFVYEMRDIKDVRIVQNYIYVWNKKDMRVIGLMGLELLLLKVLTSKQYVLTIELCIKYKEKVLKLLDISDTLKSLQLLKDKCKAKDDLKCLEEIFKLIDGRQEGKTIAKSKIVKVENGHFDEPSCSYKINVAKPVLKHKPKKNTFVEVDVTHVTKEKQIATKNGHKTPAIRNEVKITIEPMQDINYINNILYKQFQVNQLYNNIETSQLHELLSSRTTLDDTVQLFDGFIQHVSANGLETDNNNVRYWCYSQYLKYVNNRRDSVTTLDSDSMALKYIFEAFKFNINSTGTQCDCKFPLPLPEVNYEYFHLARDVYYKLALVDREQLLLSVPLLWMLKMKEAKEPLALIMQLGNSLFFREQSEKFTFDQWNDCTTLLVKLKRGHCLNCERKINIAKGVLTWKEFALIMLKRIGGLETTKILKKYAKFIPNNELGYEFYQSCLFSAVSKENGKSCDFMANVLTSARLENQFEDGLKQYLSQKYLGVKDPVDMFISSTEREKMKGGFDCSLCRLMVKNPILEMSTRLSCGHLFHKLCLESFKGICSICVHLPT